MATIAIDNAIASFAESRDINVLAVSYRWAPQTRAEESVKLLLLTVPEAARMLAISRTALYQLIWEGEITPVRIGRSVRFTPAELERFVAARAAQM